VEQVRSALERWNSGTHAVHPDEVHPDLELWTLFSSVSGEPYRGLDHEHALRVSGVRES